jgi:hypothetical protein
LGWRNACAFAAFCARQRCAASWRSGRLRDLVAARSRAHGGARSGDPGNSDGGYPRRPHRRVVTARGDRRSNGGSHRACCGLIALASDEQSGSRWARPRSNWRLKKTQISQPGVSKTSTRACAACVMLRRVSARNQGAQRISVGVHTPGKSRTADDQPSPQASPVTRLRAGACSARSGRVARRPR